MVTRAVEISTALVRIRTTDPLWPSAAAQPAALMWPQVPHVPHISMVPQGSRWWHRLHTSTWVSGFIEAPGQQHGSLTPTWPLVASRATGSSARTDTLLTARSSLQAATLIFHLCFLFLLILQTWNVSARQSSGYPSCPGSWSCHISGIHV